MQNSEKVAPILDKKAPTSIHGKAATDEVSDFIKAGAKSNEQTYRALSGLNQEIHNEVQGRSSYADLSTEGRRQFRSKIYLMSSGIDKLVKTKKITDPTEVKELNTYSKRLDKETKYIPGWVKVAVACFLGFGTMVGWRRVVVTVGEKIGKEHLNYGQGASAELVAMGTIGLADWFGLPVSTTHVLSSGVAGTMAANHSGLQAATLRNIVLAWVLTLPACVLLGASIFSFALYILFHLFGVR